MSTFAFNTSSNTISFSFPEFLNIYLLKLNGAAQGANWKLLANNRDNFLTVYNKKNNIIQTPVINTVEDKKYVDSGNNLESLETFYDKFYDIQSFKEPPVEYNLPVRHVLNVNKAEEDIEILSSYDNEKDKFANKNLQDALKIDDEKTETIYEKLKNPIQNINVKEIEYSDIIFPKKDLVGFKDTRIKSNYHDEIAGTGSNGYDRNISQIKKFWAANPAARARSSATTFASPSTSRTGSINSLNIPFYVPSNTSIPAAAGTGNDAAIVTNFLFPRSTSFNNLLKLVDGVKYKTVGGNTLSQTDSIFILENKRVVSGYFEDETFPEYVNFYSIHDFDLDGTGDYSPSYIGELSPYRETEIKYFVTFPTGAYVSETFTGSNSQELTRYNFAYNNNSIPRPRPKPQFLFINHRPSYGMAYSYQISGTLFGGSGYINLARAQQGQHFVNFGMEYNADTISNNTPWYNSYEDFFENIKPFSKKYSLISEYRVSDFMEYFIKDQRGNFFSTPIQNYLTLSGAPGEVNSNTSSYVFTSNFNKFIFDNEGDKKIKIKVNAVKKLLPYNGFYPSQRSVQIVDLFNKSFFNLTASDYLNGNIAVTNATSSQGVPIDQQVLTVIQPLFAPGVLFNTIKASIAVDFPTFITDSVDYSSSVFPSFYSTASSTPLSSSQAIYTIGQNYNYRFPFKSILDINNMIPNEFIGKKLYYLNPTFYSADCVGWDQYTEGAITYVPSGIERAKYRFPQYLIEDKNRDYNQKWKELNSLYTLGINNYLAEIVKFFLKDGSLNSFKSKQQNELNLSVVSGTNYSMQVSLYRTDDQKQILNSKYGEFRNPPSALAFVVSPYTVVGSSSKQDRYLQESEFYGPPARFWNSKNLMGQAYQSGSSGDDFEAYYKFVSTALPTKINEDPAYAAHAPPYYYGRDVAILTYTPELTGLVTLKDIVSNLKYTYQNEGIEEIFNSKEPNNYKNSPAYNSRMKLDASVKFDNILKGSTVTYDQFGNPININESEQSVKDIWSIQTIFETPLLNFNNAANKAYAVSLEEPRNAYYENTTFSKQATFINKVYGKTSGLWYGYGDIPQENQGIFLSISDVSGSDTNVKSLIDLCKFERGTKKIGAISSTKKISEAIIMIPYVEKNGNFANNLFAKNIKGIVGENGVTATTTENGPFYFEINRNTIDKIIDSQFQQSSEDQIKKILQKTTIDKNNSIVKCLKGLSEYNVPPHLDWLANKDINPFVMYFVEFEEQLTSTDLSNIWQGLMPSIAKVPKLDESTFEHVLSEDEFFHGKELPDNIKFKVFKVKKKATTSYYELTDDPSDDERFKFNFQNSAGNLAKPTYSYNWPYDYFSLVELVNIEAGGIVTSGSI